MKRTVTILTIISLSLALLGGLWRYDQTKANASDMLVVREEIKLLHARFTADQRIRRGQAVQERIWVISDRYEGKTMPVSVREEKRRLQAELEQLRNNP